MTIDQPALDGYFWASPQNDNLKEDFYKCWDQCMEAQCTEFYAPAILDIFTTADMEKIIPKWTILVRPGGKIILGGTDLYIMARAAIRRTNNLGMINNILFNRDYTPTRSLTSAESTRKFLETLGFKINDINVDYSNFTYTVEAIKAL